MKTTVNHLSTVLLHEEGTVNVLMFWNEFPEATEAMHPSNCRIPVSCDTGYLSHLPSTSGVVHSVHCIGYLSLAVKRKQNSVHQNNIVILLTSVRAYLEVTSQWT